MTVEVLASFLKTMRLDGAQSPILGQESSFGDAWLLRCDDGPDKRCLPPQELDTYRVFSAEQDFKYASETFLQVRMTYFVIYSHERIASCIIVQPAWHASFPGCSTRIADAGASQAMACQDAPTAAA